MKTCVNTPVTTVITAYCRTSDIFSIRAPQLPLSQWFSPVCNHFLLRIVTRPVLVRIADFVDLRREPAKVMRTFRFHMGISRLPQTVQEKKSGDSDERTTLESASGTQPRLKLLPRRLDTSLFADVALYGGTRSSVHQTCRRKRSTLACK